MWRESSETGPGGIPAKLINVTVEKFSALGCFPESWKTARLVLIEKPRKPGDMERRYRPLCLLNTAGKLKEHLAASGIIEEITKHVQLSKN